MVRPTRAGVCVGADRAHTYPTGIHTAEELLTHLINIRKDQALGVKDLTPHSNALNHTHMNVCRSSLNTHVCVSETNPDHNLT